MGEMSVYNKPVLPEDLSVLYFQVNYVIEISLKDVPMPLYVWSQNCYCSVFYTSSELKGALKSLNFVT